MDLELAAALLGRPGTPTDAEGAARFRAIAELLPHLVWVVGADGQTEYVNGRVLELTGAGAGDLLGPGWLAATHPEDRGALADAMAGTAPFEVQHRLRRRDGAYVRHTARATPIPGPDGAVAKWLGTSTDVDAVAERAARLEARFVESHRLETIGRLSAVIAHDFNNLLTAIGGFSHLAVRRLDQGVLPTTELSEVLLAAQRAEVLVRQLLSFTSAERQLVGPLDVNAELGGLKNLLQAVAGNAVVLELELAGGLPRAMAGASAVEQIALNLVSNARDALPDGGPVTVSTAAGPGYVALRVHDGGVGMDEATRSRAGEPFFTTKAHGIGLGLSTVHDLVGEVGGTVELESAPRAGTTVTVLFPLAEPAPAAAPGEAAPPAVGSETILVVEDVEPVRRFLVDALTEAGYRVLAAESAEQALDLARGSPVHLLLSDIVMPGLSGTELAERMERVRPGLRVLLMSGYAEEDLGGRDFILKPFDADALALRVREILDRAA